MQNVKRILNSLLLVLLLSASVEAASLTLTWQDNSSAENGFEIDRCLGVNCVNFTLLVTVAANVTTYIDATLGELQTASYRVRATATGGIVSTYSNVGTATSRINAPTNLLVQ